MKNLKKYVGVLMLLTLLVGFTSCEDDETIFDHIVGRTWVGDLGFWVDNSPVESGITFKSNGYPLLILADVYVEGRYLTGRLYSNNIDQGTVTLEMSN